MFFWWTLSPYASTTVFNYSFIVSPDGTIGTYDVKISSFSIRPVLYLSPDIKITGGDGSNNNPYEISL